MKRSDIDIYRELYPEVLNEIWGKIAELLAGHSLSQDTAEFAALQIVEWIRRNWGGQIRVSRRLTDPRPQKPAETMAGEQALIEVPVPAAPAVPESYRKFHGQVSAILAPLLNSCHEAVGLEVVQLMQRDFRSVYITKVPKLDQLQRDSDIWLKSRGAANMDEMVSETGLTAVRIYQIAKEVQRRKNKREQPMLPLL